VHSEQKTNQGGPIKPKSVSDIEDIPHLVNPEDETLSASEDTQVVFIRETSEITEQNMLVHDEATVSV